MVHFEKDAVQLQLEPVRSDVHDFVSLIYHISIKS